ncbi:MAG: TolC family protein, partial [Pseudomonadota bacterium]
GAISGDGRARLGWNVPIYRGGQLTAAIATAQARLAETDALQDGVRRDLRRALTSALADISDASVRLQSAQQAVDVNSQALEAAQGQFQLGKGSLLSILDAQRAIHETQLTLIDLRAETARAEYGVLAGTGDVLTALGMILPSPPDVLQGL